MLWDTGEFCAINAELDTNSGELTLTLQELPLTVVARISIVGNDSESDEWVEISTIDNLNSTLPEIQSHVDSLLQSIKLEGYSFANVTTTEVDDSMNTLTLHIDVPRITRIRFDEGLKSRDSLIMREFQINTGDPLNLINVMGTVENLYASNLYELVYVDAEKYENGVGLTFHLTEKDWSVARFGIRYDESARSEGRISLSRENILGSGNQVAITARTGHRNKTIKIENKIDRIYKSLYSFNISMYNKFRKRPIYERQAVQYEYEDNRWGSIISFGQQMDRFGKAMLALKSETVRMKYPETVKKKIAKKEIRSVVAHSIVDSYDRYPFPKNGAMNIIYIESATKVLGGSEQYAKIFWGSSLVKTFMEKHTISGSFFAGTADPSMPESERFTLGGTATRINCYDYDSARSQYYVDFLGLYDEEKSGTRIAVAKIDYRLFIPRIFYLDLIYSVGNVWESQMNISKRTLLQSYGIKGSLATLGGPLSAGWGITSEGQDRFYISAGWEF